MCVKHAKIQEKLLSRDVTLTLDAAMDAARTHETTLVDVQQFTGEANISHISRANKRWPPRDASRCRDSQPACMNCGCRHDMNDR